eukprot:2701523-Alexandrium_andersonii.AAC.1
MSPDRWGRPGRPGHRQEPWQNGVAYQMGGAAGRRSMADPRWMLSEFKVGLGGVLFGCVDVRWNLLNGGARQ